MHLKLRKMNTRVVIQKNTGQVVDTPSPVLFQPMTQKAYQQGPHSKINPSRFQEGPHAGIDQRVPGLSKLPSLDVIASVGPCQVGIRLVNGLGFVAGFLLEFLDKMVMPLQPVSEGFESGWGSMHHLAYGQVAPSQIRRYPSAGSPTFQGFG